MSETEKEDMIEHFNATVDGLGDTMFGDDANVNDLIAFVDGLEDE